MIATTFTALGIAGCAGDAPPVPEPPGPNNPLAMALAWKQTAVAYDALYIQGFNIARMHVDKRELVIESGNRAIERARRGHLPRPSCLLGAAG